MTRVDGTWRAVALVAIILTGALALTGAASSAYKRERSLLGERHYLTGVSLASQGLNQQAAEEFRKALLFAPESAQYGISLASALVKANDLSEAESHLEELEATDGSNPVIYVELAEIALKRNQIAKAIREYQRAVYEYWPADEIPRRRAARWTLVQLLASQGRRNEAIGELMQLYASSPPGVADRERIGDMLLQFGAVSEATRVFSDVVRTNPESAVAQRGLAQVQFTAGDFVQARHSYQRALHDDPKDAQSIKGLALTNSVIELDPAVAGIGSGERRKRSAALLGRVLQAVGACAGGGSGQDAQRWQYAQGDADRLIAGPHPPDEDVTYEMQQMAIQLWNDRRGYCGDRAPTDPAIDAVIARLQ